MSEDRKTFLIALAACLALVRFVFWPWLDTQAEARDELQVLTQRLDRSLGVIENREAIIRAENSLVQSVGRARKSFPLFESADSFRLETQQQLTNLLSSNELTVSSFAWTVDGESPDSVLKYGRARIQFSGDLQKLASMHGEIESRFPNVRIREFNLLSEGPVGNPQGARGSLNVVLDAFYRGGRGGKK